MSTSDRLSLLESLLFVSDRPLPAKELASFLGADDPASLESDLESLADRHETRDGGLRVEKVAGGWRLSTRPEHGESVKEFFRFKNRQKLSRAALETLAIVAYRQPATHPEIQEIRGVASEGVVKTLLDRRLVRVCGRKDTVGKPVLYGTTGEFLEHFGLASLDDLPPIEELEALLAEVEDGAAVQAMLSVQDVDGRREPTPALPEPNLDPVQSPPPGPRSLGEPEPM